MARTPGAVLREGGDRFLMTFGFALGQYIWTVVADAAESLGGGPVGVDALERSKQRGSLRRGSRARRCRPVRDLFRTRRMWRGAPS